jgi:hypothetical protein
MEALIKLGGIYNIVLVVFHLLFWRIFNWEVDLRSLTLLNRAIMQVVNLSLTFVFVIFAYIFMIVTTSNMKSSDLGKGFVLKDAPHIDDVLQPLIMTNNYLSIRNQIPTVHADNVIAGDTNWIESAYEKHLNTHFK